MLIPFFITNLVSVRAVHPVAPHHYVATNTLFVPTTLFAQVTVFPLPSSQVVDPSYVIWSVGIVMVIFPEARILVVGVKKMEKSFTIPTYA